MRVPPLRTSWIVSTSHITKNDEERLDYRDDDSDYDEDEDPDKYVLNPLTVIPEHIDGPIQQQAFGMYKRTGWFVPVPPLTPSLKADILKYGFSEMFYRLLEETVSRGHGIVIIDASGDIVDSLEKRPS